MNQQLAVIGTGVIGNGWIARALGRGWDVVAFDPAPGAEARTRTAVSQAWPSLERLGLAEGADPARLSFVDSLEAGRGRRRPGPGKRPRAPELKREILARLDAAADPSDADRLVDLGLQAQRTATRLRATRRAG